MKGLVAVLALGLSVSTCNPLSVGDLPMPREQAGKWVLVLQAVDARTGRVLATEVFAREGKRVQFDDPLDCIRAAQELGPVPAREGLAIIVRCRRADAAATKPPVTEL